MSHHMNHCKRCSCPGSRGSSHLYPNKLLILKKCVGFHVLHGSCSSLNRCSWRIFVHVAISVSSDNFYFFFCNFAKQKLGGCLFLLSKSARAGVSRKMRSSVLRKFIVAAALLSFISDKQTLPGLLGSMSEGIYWEVVWVWSGICFDISVQIHVMPHWLIQLKIGGDIKPRILYRFFFPPPFLA